jgi:hypothetical protein
MTLISFCTLDGRLISNRQAQSVQVNNIRGYACTASVDLVALYAAASQQYSVPLALLLAQGAQESSFNARVVSGDGGYGIAQWTDEGAARRYLRIPAPNDWHPAALDPVQAIPAQAPYMADLVKSQRGSWHDACAAYNGGPNGPSIPAAREYADGLMTQAEHVDLLLRALPEGAAVGGGTAVGDFLAKWDGKPVDFDKAFGPQCMDLVEEYNRDVVGAPPLGGNAIDVWYADHSTYYSKIPLEGGTLPAAGDIVVFAPNLNAPTIRTDQYGHIAIVAKDVNTADFTSMDQNWNGVRSCQYVSHSYVGVKGWLRPRLRKLIFDATVVRHPLIFYRDANAASGVLYQSRASAGQVLQFDGWHRDGGGSLWYHRHNPLGAEGWTPSASVQKKAGTPASVP